MRNILTGPNFQTVTQKVHVFLQGTRETMADTSLINIGEAIMKEAMVTNTEEAAVVASEDKLTKTAKGALTCRTVLSSKGSSKKRFVIK